MIATFEDEPYRAPFSRQRDRALPGRRADLDAVPLRGAAVGDPERADRLRALPGRLQRQRDDARGQGQADPLAQPPRGRRGLALRQGPLRVPAPLRRRPDRRRRSRASRRRGFDELVVGRRARPRRGAAARRAGAAIVTALSGSETVEQAYALGEAPAPRARRALAPCCPRRRRPRARRLPRAALGDRATPSSSSSSATTPVAERAPVVDLWIKRRAPQRRGGRRDRPTPKLGDRRARRRVLRELATERTRSASACGRERACSSGRAGGAAAATLAALAQRSARRQARLRRLPPARPRRTRAASPTPGPRRPTRTRRTAGADRRC